MELELVDTPIAKYNELEIISILRGINQECIQFFESVDTETYLVLGDGSRKQIFATLCTLEEMLPSALFLRCGWSHIINISRISSCFMLNDTTLVMDCGEKILIPRCQRVAVFNVMEEMWFDQQRQIS